MDFIDLLFISSLANAAVEELGPGGIRFNGVKPPKALPPEEIERRRLERQERETKRIREAIRREREKLLEKDRACATKREQWLALMSQRYPGVRWR
jgi:hypothetical protein